MGQKRNTVPPNNWGNGKWNKLIKKHRRWQVKTWPWGPFKGFVWLKIDLKTKPFIFLIVGINGVGKTATVGKLANKYINAKKRIPELNSIVGNYFNKYDALVSPTTIMQAIEVDNSVEGTELHERSLLASANTQPVNIFGMCAITYPIQKFVNSESQQILPIGLQVICNKDEDDYAVAIALALEEMFGAPELPDVNKFI